MSSFDPQAQWDEYVFTPQPNMTAYELALILASARVNTLPVIGNFRSPPGKSLDAKYARHFVKKTVAK